MPSNHPPNQYPCVQVEREIQIHSQLHHENVIKLFAAFEDAENVYLAQEFAAGQTFCFILYKTPFSYFNLSIQHPVGLQTCVRDPSAISWVVGGMNGRGGVWEEGGGGREDKIWGRTKRLSL